MIEIKWTDTDPQTGQRRYLRASHFARRWEFSFRLQRRDVSWRRLDPTRDMWEYVLDCLEKRYRRREGVDDTDVAAVKRILREWRQPPPDDEPEPSPPASPAPPPDPAGP